MREAFEKAIIENPDDVASYSAYADWLQEQDDPQGEFTAVQLALEDETRAKADRDALKAREAELLAAHEREWLGPLAPHLLDYTPPDDPYRPTRPRTEHRWRRGLLSSLNVQCLTISLAQALADAPAARFLRELYVRGNAYYWGLTENQPPRVRTPAGLPQHHEWFELIGAPCLQSLRLFYVGDEEAEPPEDGWCDCHTETPGIDLLIAGMTRVEELHLLCKRYESADLFALRNLTNLRVLRLYHLGGYTYNRPRYEYALDVLAANPAFANLTHLLFHPHQPEGLGDDGDYHTYLPLEQVRALVRSKHLGKLTHLQLRLSDMGDDGIREIIDSGILKRLKWLDLRHGAITDDGARLFAACPDAKRLERIDLSRNAVTAAGLGALRAAGVNAVANRPLTQAELADRAYLREGDFE
jgi:uncharacterized protein (TIGR02996 family)